MVRLLDLCARQKRQIRQSRRRFIILITFSRSSFIFIYTACWLDPCMHCLHTTMMSGTLFQKKKIYLDYRITNWRYIRPLIFSIYYRFNCIRLKVLLLPFWYSDFVLYSRKVEGTEWRGKKKGEVDWSSRFDTNPLTHSIFWLLTLLRETRAFEIRKENLFICHQLLGARFSNSRCSDQWMNESMNKWM